MTLFINDTRNNQKGILWEALEAGSVYVDKNGWYVMCVDEAYPCSVINLSNGERITETNSIYDLAYDGFVPVKAKLEIFG